MKEKQHFDPAILAEWRGKLDRSSPIPLYSQLRLLILEKIEDGTLQNGDAMPTEAELKAVLDISRPTIRQCMHSLVSDGYLTRLVGKGTFVKRQKMEFNYINKHESFHEIISKYGYVPHTEVLEFKIVPGIPKINEFLQLQSDDPLYYLKRVYSSDDDPIVYASTYLPVSTFPGLLDFDFAKLSLYSTLKNAYQSPIVMLKREIGAENGNQEDVHMLGISKGKAVFVVYNFGYGEDGQPLEYTYARYRSEVIKFTNYLKC